MSKVTQGELRTILNMQNNIRNERQKHQYLYQSTDILINLAGMRDLQTVDDNTRSNTDMSKQRVLVMNGQRVLQSEEAGKWKNDNVDRAGSIKPGIYPLYLSKGPDKASSYNGPILHADKQSVYQQVGKQIFKHDRQNFDKLPEVGTEKSISYDQTSGKAQVAAATEKQGRKFSR
ncbi:hypothetical protein MLV27_21415 [Escherichia coli]|nr:hypothetical protein [Escherichia coli]